MEKNAQELNQIHTYFNEIEKEIKRKLGGTPECVIRKHILDRFQDEEEKILVEKDIKYSYDSYTYEGNSRRMSLTINYLDTTITITYDEKRGEDKNVECILEFCKKIIGEKFQDYTTNRYVHNYGYHDAKIPKTIESLVTEGIHDGVSYCTSMEAVYDDSLRSFTVIKSEGDASSEEAYTYNEEDDEFLKRTTIVRDDNLFDSYMKAEVDATQDEMPSSLKGIEYLNDFAISLNYTPISFRDYENEYNDVLNNLGIDSGRTSR